jgi:UDP-glucose:(heptosyl)LPS alpha-1,3-glucosyltransferase
MDRTIFATHIRAGGGSHKGWLVRRSHFSSFFKNISFKVNPFHHYMLKIEKKSLENPYLRALICNSNMVRNEFIEYYNFDVNRVYVIHNGVEWKKFGEPFNESINKKYKIRKTLGLDDRFWLLYVGSGYERKGLSFIINALSKMNKSYCLAVVGKDRNENLYKKMAEEKKVSDRVRFFGPQKDVIRFLQSADAFILPTIYDPFSNATLEALAMGLYTITSSANGCSEVIKDGCGYVIEDLNIVEEMIYAIEMANNNHDRIKIRNSVMDLDFNNKLNELIDLCIKT